MFACFPCLDHLNANQMISPPKKKHWEKINVKGEGRRKQNVVYENHQRFTTMYLPN